MGRNMVRNNSSSPEMITSTTEVQSKLIQSSVIGFVQGNQKSTSKKKISCLRGSRNSSQVNHEQRIRITARLLDICIPSLRQYNRVPKRERIVVQAILGDHDHVSEKENDTLLSRLPSDLRVNPPSKDVQIYNEAINYDCRQITNLSVPTAKDKNKTLGVQSRPLFLVPVLPSEPQFAHTHHVRARRLPSYISRKGCFVDEHPLRTYDLSMSDSNTTTISDDSRDLDNASKSRVPRVQSRRRRSHLNFLSSLRSIKLIANSILSSVNILRSTPKRSTAAKVSPMEDKVSAPLASIPTIELRRYLNPDINTFLKRPSSRSITKARREKSCRVSIQMQTYKTSTSRKYPMCSVSSLRTHTSSCEEKTADICEPSMRQRDIRENSDFMRVAVMEMLMRKRGKLNNRRPGKARWALPPRAISNRPYRITADGVPVRWISITV